MVKLKTSLQCFKCEIKNINLVIIFKYLSVLLTSINLLYLLNYITKYYVYFNYFKK